jgi:hypothetical protein
MAKGKTYTTRTIKALGATASLWLVINAVSDSLEAMAAGLELYLMSGLGASTPLDEYGGFPDETGLSLITGGSRLIMLAVTLVTAFIVLKWIYRANRNAHALGRGLDSNPPWAVGWFFVPVAFLWKPFEAMEETWKVSQDPEGWKGLATPGLLRRWWGFWLVGTIAGNLTFRLGLMADNVGGLMLATGVELLSCAAFVVAGLTLRRIVDEVTAAQTRRIDLGVF